MKPFLVLVFAFMSVTCCAQDTVLTNYLRRHSYNIDLSSEHAFDMLPTLMKGKNLLLLGEGGSHSLELYTPLKEAVLDQLVEQHLKYFFIELGRSTASILDKYLHNENALCESAFTKYCTMMEHEKAALKKGHDYKIIGIDFEIRTDFHVAMNDLFKQTDLEKLPASKQFLTNLLDSTCLKMTHKQFMKFYRAKRKEFNRQQSALKNELGDKYAAVEYLVTNHNTTSPGIDRNPAMTRNFLHEIGQVDTSAVYLLTIGMAHSLPCTGGSVAHKLCKSDKLKDRVLVMNVHCENCNVKGQQLTGKTLLKFMNKEDIAACFSSAATTDLTLFDLSQLPPKYHRIKKCGDLLLLAKNQH